MSHRNWHLECSICHSRIDMWSTPDVYSEVTDGVLQMLILKWHMEYSRCWFWTDIWSTPDLDSEVTYGVLQMSILMWHLEYFSYKYLRCCFKNLHIAKLWLAGWISLNLNLSTTYPNPGIFILNFQVNLMWVNQLPSSAWAWHSNVMNWWYLNSHFFSR